MLLTTELLTDFVLLSRGVGEGPEELVDGHNLLHDECHGAYRTTPKRVYSTPCPLFLEFHS